MIITHSYEFCQVVRSSETTMTILEVKAGHGKGPCDNKGDGGHDNNTQL